MYPGKQAVLWLKRRTWPIAKLMAVICVAFWAGTQYEKGWRIAVTAPPSRGLTDEEVFGPQAAANPFDKFDGTPAAQPKPKNPAAAATLDFSGLTTTCATPPPNGAILDTALPFVRGHILKIMNGTKGDAIIKVRDAASGRMAESFFVADGETASAPNLPDGSYRIQYAFGTLAADCRSLVKPVASEFPDIEAFVPGEPGVSYTLYAVPSGNIRPNGISANAFNAP